MPQDRRAAVVTPFFADRDAVGNDVRHAAAALRRHGWDARIFAIGGTGEREKVYPASELTAFLRSREDLLYYHFSTGRRDLTEMVARSEARKWLKFHNITPPELFSLWSDELAEASRIGRAEISRVVGLRWDHVWADSEFNLAEIAASIAAGTPSGALPPFHEIDALLALKPAGAATTLPHVLTVGRIVQSKGHAFVLRVVAYLVHELATPVHLDIVGKPDHRLLGYLRLLEVMVRELRIESYVTFHGEVSAEALSAHYARASVFLSGSEHEGFCVPVVEAMAFGVPVVALATTAIPETVGDAGIVWEERDPRRFAVTVQRLLCDTEAHRWLAERGRERYAERFSNAATERRMMEALEPAAQPAVARS